MAAKKPQKALYRRKIAQNSACGGAGGIRTHGRVLAVKRFRVVLVMTTSIPLHSLCIIHADGENQAFCALWRRLYNGYILLKCRHVDAFAERLFEGSHAAVCVLDG